MLMQQFARKAAKGCCEGEKNTFLYEQIQSNFIVSNQKDWEYDFSF